jgi:hypothetical protein
MNLRKIIISVLIILLTIIAIHSCKHKYYINHEFRQTYTDANEVIHRDTTQIPFFKIHFKNGDVSILDHWYLSSNKDSITGEGTLYGFNRNQTQEGSLSFDLNEIAIIETNQLEAIKSKDKQRISTLSILTGANLIIDVACIANPKACFGSCPTFYLNETDFLSEAKAEGFSSSISPSLEKKDLDALQYSTSSKEFFLTMKNEAFETHMLNELSIFAVPKKKNENIFHDNQGKFYNCGKLYNSSSALVDQKEIGHAINSFDEIEYFSKTDPTELSDKEELIIEFDQLPDVKIGVVLNFRQTLLTTFLLYSGISYMGDEVGDYFAKIETNNQVKKRLSNPFKRLGKIKLSVWDEDAEKWNLFKEIFETGPIAKNLVLAPILKQKPKNGKLKIKVEMAKGLWRIDYLGLTPINFIAKPVVSYPSEIEVINGEKYTIDAVEKDDDDYLVSFPGNEFRFKFELPEIDKENGHELFLSSKGYYLEWIRQEWIKGKNLPKLKKMLLNDDETWLELAKEFKIIEHEMETVFWNSKYKSIQ